MDRNRALVFISLYICIYLYICMYVFQDFFSTLRALTEPKMVPYGRTRVVDNTLLRRVFSAVVIPARAWHVIEVPIGLTVRAVAATVARDLGSYSSLTKLRD